MWRHGQRGLYEFHENESQLSAQAAIAVKDDFYARPWPSPIPNKSRNESQKDDAINPRIMTERERETDADLQHRDEQNPGDFPHFMRNQQDKARDAFHPPGDECERFEQPRKTEQ